jgi:hypothetical protein
MTTTCDFYPQKKKGDDVWLATMRLFGSEYGDLIWRNVTFPPQNMATKYDDDM